MGTRETLETHGGEKRLSRAVRAELVLKKK